MAAIAVLKKNEAFPSKYDFDRLLEEPVVLGPSDPLVSVDVAAVRRVCAHIPQYRGPRANRAG